MSGNNSKKNRKESQAAVPGMSMHNSIPKGIAYNNKVMNIMHPKFWSYSFLLILSSFCYIGEANNILTSKNVTDLFVQFYLSCGDYCTTCNTYLYKNIGTNISGEDGNAVYEDGKLMRYSTRYSTPSNDWYDYRVNASYVNISYSDTLIVKTSTSVSYGTRFSPDDPPSRDFDGKEQKVKNDTYRTTITLKDGVIISIDNNLVSYTSDSTMYINRNKNFQIHYLFTPSHMKIMYPDQNDVRNFEIILKEGKWVKVK